MDLRAERAARGRASPRAPGAGTAPNRWRRATPALSSAILAIAAIALAGCVGDERAASTAPEEPAATIDGESTLYFFSPGCPDCEEVERTVVPELTDRGVELARIDVETPEGFARLRQAEQDAKRTIDVLAPVIVHEKRVLVGPDEIRSHVLGLDEPKSRRDP